MINRYKDGFIEVITGPMFSGKTEELIRRARLIIHADVRIQAFKPTIDNRFDKEKIASRAGGSIVSIAVKNSLEIWDFLEKKTRCVIIDEAQFFDENIVEIIEDMADSGIRVIVAGLDTDFRGNSFGQMGEILAKAEFVTKLYGICMKCGAVGTKTQRIKNKKIANSNEDTIVVGDKESYEVRCRQCHQIK